MIYYITSLLAITCYASLTVIAKKMQTDIPSFAFIAITMTFLATMSWIASLFLEREFSFSNISISTFTTLLLFAVINFVGFAIMLLTISKIPVVEYQIIAVLTPIISGALAYFILSEDLSTKYFIGLAFITVGLIIALKK